MREKAKLRETWRKRKRKKKRKEREVRGLGVQDGETTEVFDNGTADSMTRRGAKDASANGHGETQMDKTREARQPKKDSRYWSGDMSERAGEGRNGENVVRYEDALCGKGR